MTMLKIRFINYPKWAKKEKSFHFVFSEDTIPSYVYLHTENDYWFFSELIRFTDIWCRFWSGVF